jgi:pilus assembly protein TadC
VLDSRSRIRGEEKLTVWAFIPIINLIIWLSFAMIWIAIAFWPARVASRKGHSFIGYFLLSLLFFPLALILAYLSADRTTPLASYTAAAPVSPP